MTGRKLAVNTTVDRVTYEAGTIPPSDVAERITNPKAWGKQPESDDSAPETSQPKSGKKQ